MRIQCETIKNIFTVNGAKEDSARDGNSLWPLYLCDLIFLRSPFKSKKMKKNLSFKHPFARCTFSVRCAIFVNFPLFQIWSVIFWGRCECSNEEKRFICIREHTLSPSFSLFLAHLSLACRWFLFLRFFLLTTNVHAARVINDRRVGLESLLFFFLVDISSNFFIFRIVPLFVSSVCWINCILCVFREAHVKRTAKFIHSVPKIRTSFKFAACAGCHITTSSQLNRNRDLALCVVACPAHDRRKKKKCEN